MEKTEFSEWTKGKGDKMIDKACRGSEVPLRAFWCKARIRFYMNWVKFRIKSIEVNLIARPLACMVKLIYLNK